MAVEFALTGWNNRLVLPAIFNLTSNLTPSPVGEGRGEGLPEIQLNYSYGET